MVSRYRLILSSMLGALIVISSMLAPLPVFATDCYDGMIFHILQVNGVLDCLNSGLSAMPADLDDLSDVTLSGTTNGQVIKYNSTSGQFENENSGVSSLSSSNSALVFNASSGNVLGSPKWKLLSQSVAGSSVTSKLNQNSGTSADCNVSDSTGHLACGEHFLSGAALIGQTVNSMTVSLKKANSPTGTMTACVMTTAPACTYNFGTLPISTITTSYVSYTFTNLDSSHVIAAGEVIGLIGPAQSGANTVSTSIVASDVYDSTFAVRWQSGDTNTSDFGSSANPFKLDLVIPITSGVITATKHIMFTFEGKTQTSSLIPYISLNGDSGANYASRYSANGAGDVTAVGSTGCTISATSVGSGDQIFIVGYIDNNASTDRKLLTGHYVFGADSSSATAPLRSEFICKWDNTSAQVTRIMIPLASGTGSFTSASIFTVWGYD